MKRIKLHSHRRMFSNVAQRIIDYWPFNRRLIINGRILFSLARWVAGMARRAGFNEISCSIGCDHAIDGRKRMIPDSERGNKANFVPTMPQNRTIVPGVSGGKVFNIIDLSDWETSWNLIEIRWERAMVKAGIGWLNNLQLGIGISVRSWMMMMMGIDTR